MAEFKLTRRSPEDQTIYYIEKIAQITAERDAAYAVIAKLCRSTFPVYHNFDQEEAFREAREFLAKRKPHVP